MKKYFIIIAAIGIIITGIRVPVYSQSPTGEISQSLDEDAQVLIDKVAEKVEELKEQNKKAVSGIVQEVKEGVITILNAENTKVEVDIDETLTAFYDIVGTKIKDSSSQNITKGNYIFVTGPEIGETVTANEVYKDTQYIIMSGKITEVNQDDFTVKIVTIDKSRS